MARRATLIDSLRAANPNTIVVDAGNFSDNTTGTGLPLSQFICEVYDRLGYDAICLGPTDLLHGLDAFHVETPIVMSNVEVRDGDSTRPAFERHAMRTLPGGLRVGIFGLLTQDLPLTVLDAAPDIVVNDPFAVTEEMLDTLDREGADLVVLLSQLENALTDSVLARNPRIDAAVCGSTTARHPRRAPEALDARVLYPVSRAPSLAHLTLTVSPEGDVLDAVATETDVRHALVPDRELEARMSELFVELRELRAETIASLVTEAGGEDAADRYVGYDECAQCHVREHEIWKGSPHAGAYRTLIELGLSENVDCLRCHVVGYGREGGFRSGSAEPDLGGVQCESCHGMGSKHFEPIPEHRLEGLCVRCHDQENSPDFDLDVYLEQIRHW